MNAPDLSGPIVEQFSSVIFVDPTKSAKATAMQSTNGDALYNNIIHVVCVFAVVTAVEYNYNVHIGLHIQTV